MMCSVSFTVMNQSSNLRVESKEEGTMAIVLEVVIPADAETEHVA